VPACHWSGRSILDIYKRLWGGFIIKTPNNYVIYFAGDTGKCDIF
jgi:L-ascorbate metabolism protein UlaG (beta-lactamase superfamily)